MKKLLLATIILLNTNFAFSQESFLSKLINAPLDTNYVKPYKDVLTSRAYLAQKYTRFSIVSKNVFNFLDYKPNNDLTLGIGGSYEIFTLNIGVPVPTTLNPALNKGETKTLNIQSSIYSAKYIVDLFGQFYKGMYLQNTDTYEASTADDFYIRPDIYTQLIGLTAYRIFNDQKFSYRAAFIQNQRQKKSSGSFLLGFEIYHGLAKGDSAFIPGFVSDIKNKKTTNVQNFSFFRIGPGIGYAHTFVFWKKFYFMFSVTGNLALGNYREHNESGETVKKFSVDPGIFGKGGLGYNSENWFFGISAANNGIININKTASFHSMFSVGNARFIVAKRFSLSKKTKRKIDKVLPDVD